MTGQLRWVGGANVPSSMFGRVNASWPLAVLTLSDARLEVRIRLRLFGAVRLGAEPTNVAKIFPALGRFSEGVGIENGRGDVWVFWCRTAPQILQACRQAGYRVTDGVENVTKLVWRPWST